MSRTRLTLAAGAAALLIAACGSSHKTGVAPPTIAAPVATTAPISTTAGVTAPTTGAPAASAAPATGALSGAWSGQYSGAYQGTFALTWQQSGSNLSGGIKLSAPPVTLSIHGTVQNGAIQFGTVGSVGITYSGSVSGNSMSGSYQVQGGGGSAGGPWSASKAS